MPRLRLPGTAITLLVVTLAATAVVALSAWFALESRQIALANAGVAERNLARALTQNCDRAIEGANIVLRTSVDLLEQSDQIASSEDGLHFSEPQIWRWDDGTELGNYNTQQHWVTHSDGLFLIYTRTGANNDHVFRHRAPLFIGQVDPEKLCVMRRTERVLVPERGARLGNFGVTNVNENETWVTVAEWMQTWGPNYIMHPDNPYGADNSVYAARILWNTPNRDWDKQ